MITAEKIDNYLDENLTNNTFIESICHQVGTDQPQIIRYFSSIISETSSEEEISLLVFSGILLVHLFTKFKGKVSFVTKKQLNHSVEESMSNFMKMLSTAVDDNGVSALMNFFSKDNEEPVLMGLPVQFFLAAQKNNPNLKYERFLLIMFHLMVSINCLNANMKKKFFKEKALEKNYLSDKEYAYILTVLDINRLCNYYFEQEKISKKYPGTGRNAPCPCGSGLKYKKCCGK